MGVFLPTGIYVDSVGNLRSCRPGRRLESGCCLSSSWASLAWFFVQILGPLQRGVLSGVLRGQSRKSADLVSLRLDACLA